MDSSLSDSCKGSLKQVGEKICRFKYEKFIFNDVRRRKDLQLSSSAIDDSVRENGKSNNSSKLLLIAHDY